MNTLCVWRKYHPRQSQQNDLWLRVPTKTSARWKKTRSGGFQSSHSHVITAAVFLYLTIAYWIWIQLGALGYHLFRLGFFDFMILRPLLVLPAGFSSMPRFFINSACLGSTALACEDQVLRHFGMHLTWVAAGFQAQTTAGNGQDLSSGCKSAVSGRLSAQCPG